MNNRNLTMTHATQALMGCAWLLIFTLGWVGGPGGQQVEADASRARHRGTVITVHDLVYQDRGPFPIEVESVPAVGELVRIEAETFLVKHVLHNYTDTTAPTITIFLVRPTGLIRGEGIELARPEQP